MKTEKNLTLWKHIFKYAVGKMDRHDVDGGVDGYILTKELLMDYLEKEEKLS